MYIDCSFKHLLDIFVCLLSDSPPLLGETELQLVEVVEFVVKETNAMLAPHNLLDQIHT